MKVYVIIVTYNGVRWLDRCLGSMRLSTVPVVPVVIDNGSTDNTVPVIQASYPEVVLLKSTENLGFGKANNKGIAYALQNAAEFIFLLNQDAWIFPDTLEKLIAVSKRNPDFGILSPMHLDGTERKLDYLFAVWTGMDKCPGLYSDLALQNKTQDVYQAEFINAALWLLPRRTVETIGVFDPLFPHYGEDDDYVNRVHYHGYKMGVCPLAWGVHDRPQQSFDWNRFPVAQRMKRRRIAYYIMLKNINRPVGYCLLKACNEFFKLLVKDLLRFRLLEAGRNLQTAFATLLDLPKILKQRSESKKQGRNFLPADTGSSSADSTLWQLHTVHT